MLIPRESEPILSGRRADSQDPMNHEERCQGMVNMSLTSLD